MSSKCYIQNKFLFFEMEIPISELQRRILRGPGLVVGPGLSTNMSIENELKRHIEGITLPVEHQDSHARSFLEVVDQALARNSITVEKARNLVAKWMSEGSRKNPCLEVVMKANWTAVISLTFDQNARSELRKLLFNKPTQWTVTTIATGEENPPGKSIPYYALLGDLDQNMTPASMVVSRSQYLERMRSWSKILNTFPDVVKSDPIIFLGTEMIVDRLTDFLNELMRLEPRVPKEMIFLNGDPALNDPTLLNLLGKRFRILTVDCQLKELGELLSRETLSAYGTPLFPSSPDSCVSFAASEKLSDQVAFVPRKEFVVVNPDERNRLLDLLFRPTHLDWGPYVLDLAFRRDACWELETAIRSSFDSRNCEEQWRNLVFVEGESGIGKTVMLRNVAFALSQEGFLCVWLKRSYREGSGGRLDEIGKVLQKDVAQNEKIVFFLDDPWSVRIRPDDFIASMAEVRLNWCLVVCSRRSDEDVTALCQGNFDGQSAAAALRVDSNFSDAELARLPRYLVTLQVAKDMEEANAMMRPAGVRESRDVLCSLWYLLPQTKAAIEESIIGEYRRLGQPTQLIKGIVEKGLGKKSVVKAAYEYVTAMSGFESAGLPVEVLVSALRVSYTEWAALVRSERSIWGLIYEESYSDGDTYSYRTRNSVVTEVISRVMNGGRSVFIGEFGRIKDLIGACTSATGPYRNFLKDVLVDCRHVIVERFNLDQAMTLYDTALEAYPHDFPIIEHHRAIAMRKLGGDVVEVYGELSRLIARRREQHQSLDQDSLGNLSTTAASVVKQMIGEGAISSREGLELAYDHINEALSEDQFSLHVHHVHADLLVEIAAELREEDPKESMRALSRAGRIVDRALLLIPPDGPRNRQQHKSLELLRGVQNDVALGIEDVGMFKSNALEHFAGTGDQSMLGIAARVQLAKANLSGRGRDFKNVEKFLAKVLSLVTADGKGLAVELIACRIDLDIYWKIRKNKGPVAWERFVADIISLQQSQQYTLDLVVTFYLGVGYFHTGDYGAAEGCFHTLRRGLGRIYGAPAIQCYYLGDEAEPMILEGTCKRGRDKRFVYCPRLKTDILIMHEHLVGRDDEAKHFFVGFTMMGPIAVNPVRMKL